MEKIDRTQVERNNILKLTDHAVLKQDTIKEDLTRDLRRTLDYECACLIVPPRYAWDISTRARGDMRLGVVIDFPFGYDTPETKCAEIEQMHEYGIKDFDVVLNIGQIKMGMWAMVGKEIELLRKAAGKNTLKVILETGLLTPEEIERTCIEAVRNHVDFVKTCTGYGPRGATLEDIRIMKEACAGNCKIKASGGIHTFEEAKAFLDAGADRIGSSILLQKAYYADHPDSSKPNPV